VRGADVVHKQQVTVLPLLECGVCLVRLVDQLHDVRADRVAVAKARIEWQPVFAVDVRGSERGRKPAQVGLKTSEIAFDSPCTGVYIPLSHKKPLSAVVHAPSAA